MRGLLVSFVLLLGACDVGEVPASGGGGGGTGPDAGAVGGGGGGGGGGGTGSGSNGATGSGSGSGGAIDPATSFTTTISPLVTRCTGCHGGGQPPNLTSYAALGPQYETKPGASNILVTKAPAGGSHHGISYFSTTEKTTVAGWIDSLP